MKNKKGFTLIELLAVIVVLAIIALIATPIVMNTIKNAKKGAAERTADNYIKQVETAVAEAKLGNNSVPNGIYDIDEDGNLTGAGLPNGKLEIDMSGNKPNSGKIRIENDEVQQSSMVTVGDYDITYNNNKVTAVTIVYRRSTDKINIGDTIDSSDTSKFKKDPTTFSNIGGYLKHVLDKDNKVTESYACAILNGKEYCLTNGEYGWSENETNYTGNMLILKELKGCTVKQDYCNCGAGSTQMTARNNGSISAGSAFYYCNVNADGSSACVDSGFTGWH